MPQGIGSQGLFPGHYYLFITPIKMQEANHFEISALDQWANASGLTQPNPSVNKPHNFQETPIPFLLRTAHTFQHHQYPHPAPQLELWKLCWIAAPTHNSLFDLGDYRTLWTLVSWSIKCRMIWVILRHCSEDLMRSCTFEIPRESGTLEMPRKVTPMVGPCDNSVKLSLFPSRLEAQDKRRRDIETSLGGQE